MGKLKMITGLLVLLLLLLAAPVSGVLAASPITLDGQFDDWEGQAFMDDPSYDAFVNGDIVKFGWATNDDDSNLYFMIQRRDWENKGDNGIPTHFHIYFDMNDNGNYGEKADRYLAIHYHPMLDGRVSLHLYKQKGGKITDYNDYWGESALEGGSRCEFYVDMEELGMYPGQPIRMYVESRYGHGDRCPDNGDIQWSPIPIMPLWALITIFVAALLTGTYFIRKRMKA